MDIRPVRNGRYDHASYNRRSGGQMGAMSQARVAVGNGKPFGPWFQGKAYSVCVSEPYKNSVDVMVKRQRDGVGLLLTGTRQAQGGAIHVTVRWPGANGAIALTDLNEVLRCDEVKWLPSWNRRARKISY